MSVEAFRNRGPFQVSQYPKKFAIVSCYLDSLCIEFEAVFGDQELLNIFALISLELNHLAHLTIRDDRAIASCFLLADIFPSERHVTHTKFLLDDLENLLLVELLWEALDGCQSLTTISLCAMNQSEGYFHWR